MLDKKKEVAAVYDSGSNITVINEKVVKELRKSVSKSKELLYTISGVQGRIKKTKITVQINKIEQLEVYVVKNDNFSYDLLLGLNAIKQFKLIQDEKLRIFQRTEGKLEEITQMKKEKEKKFQTNCQIVGNLELNNKLQHLNTEKKKKTNRNEYE